MSQVQVRRKKMELKKVSCIIFVFVLYLITITRCLSPSPSAKVIPDPRVITYPGDINFALFIDGHQSIKTRDNNKNSNLSLSSSSPSSSFVDPCSSKVNSDGILKGMAAIWATHQINVRKGNPNQLKIGVSVFDSCSSGNVIQRQVVRMLAASTTFSSTIKPSFASSSTSTLNSASTSAPNNHLASASNKDCLLTAPSGTSPQRPLPILFGVVLDVDDEGNGYHRKSSSSASSSATNDQNNDQETVTAAASSYARGTFASLSLLNSFSVPVISTLPFTGEQFRPFQGEKVSSSIFSVAPSLHYMSKGVMTLVKRLNWSSATFVISDEVPADYPIIFENIAKKVSFDVVSGRTMTTRKLFKRSYTYSSNTLPESYKNTLLFLSPKETVHLIQSLKSSSNLNYSDLNDPSMPLNWIIVTDNDITDRIKGLLELSATNSSSNLDKCKTKPLFLFVPNTNIPTKEFNRYFEHEVSNFGSKSVHPLISGFSKQYLSDQDISDNYNSTNSSTRKKKSKKKLVIHSSEGLSMTMKAVHAMAAALRNLEKKHCSPFMSKLDCIDAIQLIGLKESILNQTKNLDHEISASGISNLDKFKIKFDKQNVLATNKYMLKVITADCRVIDIGYYQDFGDDNLSGGLNIDEKLWQSLELTSNTNPDNLSPVYLSSGSRTSSSLRPGAYYTIHSTPSTSTARPLTFDNSYHTEPSLGFTYSNIVTENSRRPTTTSPNSESEMDIISILDPRNKLSPPTNLLKRQFQDKDQEPSITSTILPDNSSSAAPASNVGTGSVSHFSRNSGTILEPKVKTNKSMIHHDNTARPSSREQRMSSDNVNPTSSSMSNKRKKQMTTSSISPSADKSSTSSITTWLGRWWSMVILISSIIGSLITIYVFTFLLMKSCESHHARSPGITNSNSSSMTPRAVVSSLQLLAIITTFVSAVLYLFEPTAYSCSLRQTTHNLSLALLLGIIMIRAMSLRAQKWIGLGGHVSLLNQILTLCFIVSIQVAFELSNWRFHSSNITNNIITMSLPSLCKPSSSEITFNQSYLIVLMMITLIMTWISRNQPALSNSNNEGAHLFTACSLLAPIVVASLIMMTHFATDDNNEIRNRTSASYRDIVSSLSLILSAFVTLGSLFIPILYSIHKHGVLLPSKSGSYSDSLSTAFTMFKNTSSNSGLGSNAMWISQPPTGRQTNFVHSSRHNTSPDNRPILTRALDSLSSTSSASVGSFKVLRGIKNSSKIRSKTKVKSKLSSSGIIYSPSSNCVTYSCNSPNCNFKLQTKPVSEPTINQVGHVSDHMQNRKSSFQGSSNNRSMASYLSPHQSTSQSQFHHPRHHQVHHPTPTNIPDPYSPYTRRTFPPPTNQPGVQSVSMGTKNFNISSNPKRNMIDDRSIGSTARVDQMFSVKDNSYRSAYP